MQLTFPGILQLLPPIICTSCPTAPFRNMRTEPHRPMQPIAAGRPHTRTLRCSSMASMTPPVVLRSVVNLSFSVSKPSPGGRWIQRRPVRLTLKTDEGQPALKSGAGLKQTGNPRFPPAFLISQNRFRRADFDSDKLWCACHRQAMDFDSLRGAPPPGEALFGATAPAQPS